MESTKTKVAPEAQLYMAFVISAMLDYYDDYADWDNGEYGNCPLAFLSHETTWGEFNFPGPNDAESDEESDEENDD